MKKAIAAIKSIKKRPRVKGVLCILTAGCFFAIMSNSIRYLSDLGYDSFQIVFLRNLFGLIWLLPVFWRQEHKPNTKKYGGHLIRACAAYTSMSCWFFAVGHMPLPEGVALTYTAPLFLTILAWLFLGEEIKYHRIIAIVTGFAGVMIVVRPGFHDVGWVALLPLTTACMQSVGVLMIKPLSRTESPFSMVWYMTMFMVPVSLPLGLAFWQTPDLWHLPWFMLVALSSTIVQFMLAKAYSACEITFLLPFDFFRLILTALIAFLAFGDILDIWAGLGAVVILVSSIFSAGVEKRNSRRALGGAL